MVSYYNCSGSEGGGGGGGGGGEGKAEVRIKKTRGKIIKVSFLGHCLMIIELERYFYQNVQFDPFLRLGTEE